MTLDDSENDCSSVAKQEENKREKIFKHVQYPAQESKTRKYVRTVRFNLEEESFPLSSSVLTSEEKKKTLKEGIQAAVTHIVELVVKDEEIYDDQINDVVASMNCREIVASKSSKENKALTEAAQTDKDFVRLAMSACKKTKDLGGGPKEITCAATSVLACRGLRKFSRCKLDESEIERMSRCVSRETIKLAKEDGATSNNIIKDGFLSSASEGRDQKNFKKENTIKKQSNPENKQYEESSIIQHVHITELDDEDSSSLSLVLGSKEKIETLEEKKFKGVEVAVAIIVELLVILHYKGISDSQINAIVASMLCGKIVTSKSSKGETAFLKATQNDRNFVRVALSACEKTKDLGGGRDEIECVATSVLLCRDLFKFNKYKFDESAIDRMSQCIATDTMETMKEEDDADDDSKKDASLSSISCNLISEEPVKENVKKDSKSKIAMKLDKTKILKIAWQSIICCASENSSEVSVEHSIKSMASLDISLKEKSMKVLDENCVDCISYGLAEAINICGAYLLSTSDRVGKINTKDKLLSY